MNNLTISVVIRNKNEAIALENSLAILTTVYKEDIDEIIIVDNLSTDDSLEIAQKYNCKIVTINDFTYGKATNLGIASSKSKYILILSSHAIPVGNSFFKNTLLALQESNEIAGIRYINNIENYKRAIENNFKVMEPLKFGLMTACAIVNKEVWQEHKFNEELVAIEDKEWSERVVKHGFQILDLNETFFYFVKRNTKSNLSRFKNETISGYLLHNKKFQNPIVIIASFVKKILLTNVKKYFELVIYDILILKAKFEIRKELNKKK